MAFGFGAPAPVATGGASAFGFSGGTTPPASGAAPSTSLFGAPAPAAPAPGKN